MGAIDNNECSLFSAIEAGPKSSLGVELTYLGTGTSEESRREEAGPLSLSLSLSFSPSLSLSRFRSIVLSLSHSIPRSLCLSVSRTLSLVFACKSNFYRNGMPARNSTSKWCLHVKTASLAKPANLMVPQLRIEKRPLLKLLKVMSAFWQSGKTGQCCGPQIWN